MKETWVLIDDETGLHVGWYFWLRVLDEVNRSTRYGAPFALLLLSANQREAGTEKRQEEAASHLPAAIRSTDLGGLLGSGRVGILLTEQDRGSATLAITRVLQRCAASAARIGGWQSRLLIYPEDGAEISNLLTNGWTDDTDLRCGTDQASA